VGAYLGDNGLHGFVITTPASILNGSSHLVSVKFENSGMELSASPVSLTCTVQPKRLDHASFTLPDGTGHAFYLDTNSHVIHLSLSSAAIWQKEDVTALTNAGLAEPGSGLTGLVDNAGNGRVFYAGPTSMSTILRKAAAQVPGPTRT
jgi:hypothetical protein